MGVILYLLSQILGLFLAPIGVVYGLISGFYRHHFDTGLSNADRKFLLMAVGFDMYGNVVCAELFNALLITSASTHKFGRWGETISYVIGVNLLSGTLSKTGRALNAVLDFFDKGHAKKAVENKDRLLSDR
jgi:hypothetical protein